MDAADGPTGQGAGDTGLNLATVWETVASVTADRPALIHGSTTTTWGDFEDRAARLAACMDGYGIGAGDNVALYLYNGPEYLESTFAAFKVRAATANVNYRYLESELEYLFDNSDARAIVFHADLADRLDAIRHRLTKVRVFICVGCASDAASGDGNGSRDTSATPDWAVDYETVIASNEPMAPMERSDRDLWLLYTGGTTGNPKGVMWPHSSLLRTGAATFAIVRVPVPSTVAEVEAAARAFVDRGKSVTLLPAAPLMHGTSALTSLAVLSSGGTIVTLEGRSFDADELWRAVEDNRVTQLTIVGEAFARPMLDALAGARVNGREYDISSLKVVLSSGVMWSAGSKAALHEWTSATLADSLGSSEGVGFATSVSRPGSAAPTARFSLGPDAAVFTDDGRRVRPGSTERGLLAVGGAIPIGYYNDATKTAETFREFEGRVWSVPGDYATVGEDGTISLLGRGSACINTAGEKVYPEEVEEVLKMHPMVRDANVVGVPDEKWGSAVHAVVSLDDRFVCGDVEETLRSHCREHLAGYKCPKRVHVVPMVQRGPNGKPDYRWAADVAARAH